MSKVVGIGEHVITSNVNDTLTAFALSTCIGLTLYSPLKRVLEWPILHTLHQE